MDEYISSLTLIDTHMHRMAFAREPDFANILGGYLPGKRQQENAQHTLPYKMLIDALRIRLGLPESADASQVEAERNRRIAADTKGYYLSCFADANVCAYCMDIGNPLRGEAFTKEENDFFDSCLPEGSRNIMVRIERVLDEIFPLQLSFDEFERRFCDELYSQIKLYDAVALKSAIAYYGGLALSIPTREQARSAYESLLVERVPASKLENVLFTHMLMTACEIAHEADIPVQIHTGFGNGIHLDHRTFNPTFLTDFLRDRRILDRVKIVLLHSGQPHAEYTGYLVSQYSNVYTDVSGLFPAASFNAVTKFLELLEHVPLNKVMYGSDGVSFPELFWFVPARFRAVLSDSLQYLMDKGIMNHAQAMEFSKMIAHENALECYTKLDYKL